MVEIRMEVVPNPSSLVAGEYSNYPNFQAQADTSQLVIAANEHFVKLTMFRESRSLVALGGVQ